MPLFELTLHKTYYEKGFFNVPVDYDKYVRSSDGPVELVLGTSGARIKGRVDRRANKNGTSRIMGGARLRDWFQKHYAQDDRVGVDLSSFASIQFRGVHSAIESNPPKPPAPDPTEEIGAEALTNWRRRIVRLLNSLYAGPEDNVAARISHLSRLGQIPREVAAMMRLVTEMRNASEYQRKILTESESIAVEHAWKAILEWADSRGLAI